MAVSESCRLHDSSFVIRSFTKSELASQSNVRSCANLSSYKPNHGTFCVVLRSHFLLCKALNPEGQIVGMTTFSCIPTISLHPGKNPAHAQRTAARHELSRTYEFSVRTDMTGVLCCVCSQRFRSKRPRKFMR